MIGGKLSWTVALALVAALGVSCAKIRYRKVPTPTQYPQWTKDMQEDADAMEGPRYYLPRPFLYLKQPVPVAARTAFLSFAYDSSTKSYAIQKPEEAPGWVKRLLPKNVSISAALALELSGGAQQSGTAGGEPPDPGATPPPKEPSDKPSSTINGRVGFINDEDPVTELGSLMDVVYLPDFEEQFVIQRSWGMGRGSIEVELRNGWAAEVFGEEADRSNFIPYVIDQVESASTAALNVARDWGLASAGVPVGALPLAPDAGQQQSAGAGAGAAALDVLGNLVLLKVVEVRIAQPGLYPILKPREIRDWFELANAPLPTGVDEDARFEDFLRARNLAWIRPNQVFVPAPPMTMIGFNTTTEAYVGAVTKEQLGLGSLHAADDGKGDGVAALKAKVLAKIKASVAGLSDNVQAAAAKLNADQPKIEEAAGGQSTKITFGVKVGQTLAGADVQVATYQDWMASAFSLGAAEKAAIKLSGTPSDVILTDLPPLATLAK